MANTHKGVVSSFESHNVDHPKVFMHVHRCYSPVVRSTYYASKLLPSSSASYMSYKSHTKVRSQYYFVHTCCYLKYGWSLISYQSLPSQGLWTCTSAALVLTQTGLEHVRRPGEDLLIMSLHNRQGEHTFVFVAAFMVI